MAIFESRYGEIEPRGISITERVFEGLAGDPGRVVVSDGPTGREMTAGALKEGIQRLAGGLNAQGFGKGSVTALMAPNLPEYCLVFHGVAYAGGTVTTINPTYTAGEVRHQLIDAGARLLVTIPAFLDTARDAAEGTKVERIVIIGQAEGAEPLNSLMGDVQTEQTPVDTARDVVVLPYSSGTTGLPKGVMLSHDNLVVNVDQTLVAGGLAPDEVAIAFLPFFHIYGMTVQMNLYLGSGRSVVTMPRFDLELFLQLVEKHKARQLWVVPPVALALAKHPMIDQYDLTSVVRVFSGAAPLGADTCTMIQNRLGCDAVQGYGMTELSPVSHSSRFDAWKPGSSGPALVGTRCRIVSEDGRDLGPNEEGELWIKGPQVMLGYLNNPKATEETIVEDGWLRTGDLAVIDEEGFMFIRDRVKELIKVKGFQVAPAELEAVLNAHPGIMDAAVIGVPDEEAGELPMAFIVPVAGVDLSEEDVKAHVAGQLATYKKLSRVAFVDAIPKSASGKILRRLLRDQVV
ncbi:MAG: AMP-binding protein [Paracoccaceae bacterium]|nr:AMP-binding protein [Paracoccaceae bacterium]